MDADIKQQDLPATLNFGEFNLEENVIHPKAIHNKPINEEHQIKYNQFFVNGKEVYNYSKEV